MPEGRLLLIGTPIGNLDDLSPRARRAIEGCDLLLCEDTRHTRKLLTHFGINVPVESFHEHNEDEKSARILERLGRGETIGVVSDAGMPLLSDPGFPLVRAARASGIAVEPVPGPFAAALAVAASGLPPLPFAFLGFTPQRRGERIDFYRSLRDLGMTAVVYESPHRLVDSLRDLAGELGEIEVTVAREMTKLHEEFVHGTASEVARRLEEGGVRGEVTLVIAPVRREAAATPDAAALEREFLELRERGMRRNDALRLLADRYGLSKNDLYKVLAETR
jgi:16S rRNA (cytidine1402-2'-O)-methyltransferase